MSNDHSDHLRACKTETLGQLIHHGWYTQTLEHDVQRGRISQSFKVSRVSPATLDALLEDGWRHFGPQFFRQLFDIVGRRLRQITPLRIPIQQSVLTRDQRRALKKNIDCESIIRTVVLEKEHYNLFEQHIEKFTENRPTSLENFIGLQSSAHPCPYMMCEIRLNGTLIATSFFDVGLESLSSIYAMYDTRLSRRSLGTLTLLKELEFAQKIGKRFLYTGYAHIGDSYYDYKKRFIGTEIYDWQGNWRPYAQLNEIEFPQHHFLHQDIPEELL